MPERLVLSGVSRDRIRIGGIRVICVIGLNEWERLVEQEVVLDLALHTDTRRAGETDDIQETVNYRTVAHRVVEHVGGSTYRLIEALAESVAKLCLEQPGVAGVEVSVRKPGALRHSEWVGVDIVRMRGEDQRPEDVTGR